MTTPAAQPGIIGNIMNVFRPSNQPVVQAPAPQNPDPVAFQGTPQSPQVNSESVASPLDNFTALLKTNDNPENQNQLPSVNLDVAKLTETVQSMNFGVDLTPDDAAKMGLNPEQAVVMNQLLNRASQAAFLRSAVANSSVSEQLAHRSIDYMGKNVPEAIRSQALQSELAKNPVFSHDAANPFVTELAAKIAQNMPNATPVQIAEQTQTYLQLLANIQSPESKARSQQVDWSKSGYFNP